MSIVAEIAKAYPGAFLVFVVGPILAGLLGGGIGAWGGFENLRQQLTSNQQADRTERGVLALQDAVGTVQGTLATLVQYQQTLANFGKRDAILTAVIEQYEHLRSAAAANPATGDTQLEVASTILDVIQRDVLRVTTRPDLPGRPLVIGVAPNTFRVIFSVPMRIPPRLLFTGLPPGVQAQVVDVSQISFTVTFSPESTPVTDFGFTADADL